MGWPGMSTKQRIVRLTVRHLMYLETMLREDADMLVEEGEAESEEYDLVQTLLSKMIRAREGVVVHVD